MSGLFVPGIGIERGMFRDRKLLDLCQGDVPCMLMVDRICRSGRMPSVPAHSNLQRHGRGKDNKSHDCFSVPGCVPCHYWLDHGKDGSREEKEAVFEAAFERWILHLWRRGLIKVA